MNICNVLSLQTIRQKLSWFAGFLFLTLNCSIAHAQGNTATSDIVSIKDAWVRPTNPGQEVGAAYMTLTSSQNLELLSAVSDVTDSIEVHSMTMEHGVMKMRRLDTLPLEAGKPYHLSPGGFHLMLFDLKKPLVIGEKVNFILTFKSKNNPPFKQSLKANIQAPKEQGEHHH